MIEIAAIKEHKKSSVLAARLMLSSSDPQFSIKSYIVDSF